MKDFLLSLLPVLSSKKSYILFFVPIAIYLSTASFDYALDDGLYITSNNYTQKGFPGIIDHLTNEALTGFYGEQRNILTGGRYRPLAPITYTIEYALFGLKPGVSHLINAILYGYLVLGLFNLFNRYSASESSEELLFFGLLLFATHPIHAEVVANIKGRDQIMAMLFIVGSTRQVLTYLGGNKKALFAAGILFFLALLSKESSITFLPLLPLSFYFFDRYELKSMVTPFIVLLGTSIIWFVLRALVIQGFESVEATTILNDPFLHAGPEERYATLFAVLIIAIKLLLFPFPLTHDYYPFHIELQQWDSPMVWAGIILFILGLTGSILGIAKRKSLGFWLFFFAATYSISSNVFFNIGSFFNERFLFEASLAICFLLSGLIVTYIPRQSKYLLIAVSLIFSVLAVNRSFAWKDNYTLFTTDVQTSAKSVKSLIAAGGSLLDAAVVNKNPKTRMEQLNLSIDYLEKATSLLPTETNGFRLLGNAYYQRDGISMELVSAYKSGFQLIPGDQFLTDNILIILRSSRNSAKKRVAFGGTFKAELETNAEYHYMMGLLYGQEIGDLNKGLAYFKKAGSLDNSNVKYINKIGLVQGLMGNYEESITTFERSLEIEPFNAEALDGAAAGYFKMGNATKAEELKLLIRKQ